MQSYKKRQKYNKIKTFEREFTFTQHHEIKMSNIVSIS